MPRPILNPDCGKENQPPCPPEPATSVNGQPVYTLEDMQKHGQACYNKGALDTMKVINDYKDHPGDK